MVKKRYYKIVIDVKELLKRLGQTFFMVGIGFAMFIGNINIEMWVPLTISFMYFYLIFCMFVVKTPYKKVYLKDVKVE